MKKTILFAIVAVCLAFASCGTKSNESSRSFDESYDLLMTSLKDSTLSFEDYQPIFEEMLDTLQHDVLNSPDAEWRFTARQLPVDIIATICMFGRVQNPDSIWELYAQRCYDIYSTWYVQQMVDSTDNSPFIILSYAAPYDLNGFKTRLSFTYSENNNPQSEPVLVMVLPVDAYDDNPVVVFADDKHTGSADYSHKKGNMDLFGSKEEGMTLYLYGSFLEDMLSYDNICVAYTNVHGRLVQVVVKLNQFQQQYQSAHKWMENY